MPQSYQVIPRRHQCLLRNDRLKLCQHHCLSALRVASQNGIMCHEDAFLCRIALRFHAEDNIGKFLCKHFVFFITGKPRELCSVCPPVKSRQYRNIHIIKGNYLRSNHNMHILAVCKHFRENFELSFSVMVRCATHNNYLL